MPRDPAGSAGQIVQLAHAFGPLAGIGSVLAPGGGSRPAARALADQRMPPFEPGSKEGIALLAGVPGATALSLLAAAEAATVTAMMEATAALSIAAVGAPADPYDAGMRPW